MQSKLKEFDDKRFNEFIKSKLSGLIIFSAPWCAACKLITPVIEKVAQINKDLVYAKIDVAKNPGLASKMAVMSLPNILLIKNGKVAEQIIGATSQKELEKKLKVIS